MLRIKLDIFGEERGHTYQGTISNVSSLNQKSDYRVVLEDVAKSLRLKGYPRWSEPVQGLVARCLSLSAKHLPVKSLVPWTNASVSVGIQGGGIGPVREIARGELQRLPDAMGLFKNTERGLDKTGTYALRQDYSHPWLLAEHILRIGAWGRDIRAHRKDLRIPIYKHLNISYVDILDIPEPARTVFKERIWHSTRPYVPFVEFAAYSGDWNRFLNGE